MPTRRDFLATTGLAASAIALAARRADAAGTASPILTANTEPDPQVKVLLLEALNAARIAGAGWADARIQRQRRQNLGTREQQVTNVSDTDTIGCGVRVTRDLLGHALVQLVTRPDTDLQVHYHGVVCDTHFTSPFDKQLGFSDNLSLTSVQHPLLLQHLCGILCSLDRWVRAERFYFLQPA
jgi:hypothetical protein